MCRQGAPALVASPLPIQPYATFSCRTARHHAVDRPGRWRGRQRGAQQDQRSERRLDCHHRGVGIRSYGRGVCRRQLQRRALEPRRDDRPRLHRQVRLGEGACVYRGAAARRVARRRDRVARLSATLARDGEPGSQAGRVLHRARHPQHDRQSPHRSDRTFVLVLGVLAILTPKNLNPAYGWDGGFGPFLVGILVWAIGLSLGGPTGYAINPARDLGPRIAHALLPIAGKGNSDWGYAWIPVAGPIIGGLIAAFVYKTWWPA